MRSLLNYWPAMENIQAAISASITISATWTLTQPPADPPTRTPRLASCDLECVMQDPDTPGKKEGQLNQRGSVRATCASIAGERCGGSISALLTPRGAAALPSPSLAVTFVNRCEHNLRIKRPRA
jgi:hypothetical protein